MSTTDRFDTDDLGSVWLLLVGLAIGLFSLEPILFVVCVVAVFLVGWLYLVDYDYVTALSVFMALMPVWMFLKWVDWPTVALAGRTLHLATVLKEVVMLVFFSHWLYSAYHSNRATIRLTPALIGFFVFVVVTLLQAGWIRYPMLLRPYVETFVLVGVPLLSINLTEDDIERLLIGVVIGGGIAAVVALYHAFIDPQFLLDPAWVREDIYKTRDGLSAYFGPRLQSFTGNPNNLGRLMLLTGVISFGLTFHEKSRQTLVRRGTFGTVFVLSTVVLMLTRSRDDIGFLAIAIVLFILFQRRTIPLLFGGAIFGLGIALNLDQIYQTFQVLLVKGNPRFEIWLSGIRFYGLELLHGVGKVESEFLQQGNPYDSTYFRILLQTGIGGMMLFLMINLKITVGLAKRIVERRSAITQILFVFLSVLLGGFLFGVNLLVFPFSLYYWFILVLGIRNIASNDSSEAERSPWLTPSAD